MLSALPLVAAAVFDPRRAAPLVARAQPLGSAALVLAGASVAEALATLLAVRATTGALPGAKALIGASLLDFFCLVLLVLVGAVFLPFAAVTLMRGRGSVGGFLWPLAFSYAPWMLWAGLGGAIQMTSIAASLWILGHLVLGGWILSIQVRALAGSYQISILRALFAAAAGYGLAAGLYLASSALGFLSFVSAVTMWTP